MIAHWFLAATLAVIGLETAVVGFMAYRAHRRSEQIEALTASYREGRKALSRSR